MYNDRTLLLYLTFLCPLLQEITSVNLHFQADDADVTKLYCDLRILLLYFARRIFKPSFLKSNDKPGVSIWMIQTDDVIAVQKALENVNSEFRNSLLDLKDIDFGSEFEEELQRNPTLDPKDVVDVKKKCLNFMIKFVKELTDRLPLNIAVVSKIQTLSPYVCLGNQPDAKELPWDLADPNCDKQAIQIQWKKLGLLKLEEIIEVPFKKDTKEKVIIKPIPFWIAVSEMRNAVGQKMFKELSNFALRALSLPISNAVVERVFSIMAIVKTKIRNKLSRKMLIAILRIRLYFNVRNLCCDSFEVNLIHILFLSCKKLFQKIIILLLPLQITPEMLSLHNMNMYRRENDNPDGNDENNNLNGNVENDEEVLLEMLDSIEDC